MNTYEITFTRENGSTGKDRITAANEKQARKDFREIYRHSSATITDVIVAAENVPASKQQERDALDQIRAIVDTLGPDSYLATAFAGCFEDAEENIKNDFACSMKQRLESAEAKRIEAELGYNRLVDKLAESEKALEAARADIEKKDEEIAALDARISAIQRPAEPAEISDELLADLATFSSVYIERIQKAIDDCPICGKFIPPFQYCPSCGAKWSDADQNVETLLASMMEETRRMIAASSKEDGRVAWYWSFIGSLDMARQLGLITEERRQELYEKAKEMKP